MRSRVLSRLVILPFLTVFLASPAWGQGFFSLSEEQEIELGRQAAEEIEKEYPILQDANVTAYIERLGQKLVAESGRTSIDYHFKVVDSADINAFALPGGWIYVNRGLIEAATQENELAGVLAHEIGHVVGRHSAEQVKKLQLTSIGLGVLDAILGRGTSGQIAGLAGQFVASGVFMKYSRDAEREADRLGAQNLYDAEYDPRGMVTFFEKLASLRQQKPNALNTFFSTHPSPQERAENISDLIESLPSGRNMIKTTAEFAFIQRRLERLPPPVGQPTETDESPASPTPTDPQTYRGEDRDRQIAAAFAPVFQIGVTADPRYDVPTRFDFDGDWRADNNWRAADQPGFDPRASVYYALSETETHFFIHYSLFFPVDDPRIFDRRARSHENDFETCLVVVEKDPENGQSGRVALVQTLESSRVVNYVPGAALLGGFEALEIQQGHPRLFVDPNGHSIRAYRGDESRSLRYVKDVLDYSHTGRAESPLNRRDRNIGYDLLPIYPLWTQAGETGSQIYGATADLGRITISTRDYRGRPADRSVALGQLGVNFRSESRYDQGGPTPWGREIQPESAKGEWFLNPAAFVRRQFNLSEAFSTIFLHQPYLGVFR